MSRVSLLIPSRVRSSLAVDVIRPSAADFAAA
jgi:hypothetical protein